MFLEAIFHKSKYPVAVIIPIYKSELTQYERVSLDRCLQVLSTHPIIIIAPESLSLKTIQSFTSYNIAIEYFDNNYFKDVEGYSKLLLRSEFYEKFLDYEYILIHQLDAFVFSDQLNYWCTLSYDYIGAPWVGVDWGGKFEKSGFGRLRNFFQCGNRLVGNGGFSLRKISSFLLALGLLKKKSEKWTYFEDVFWSYEVPNYIPFFRIPTVRTALNFSFELEPADCFAKNNNSLPFGCHAWEKYDIDFWRPKFKKLGYEI